MKAVFDANVVLGGICWHGEGWLCLTRLAQRRAFAYGTVATIEETRQTALELIKERRPAHNAAARLTWYLEKVRIVEPAALGKARSRDPKDDAYIAAAHAAGAHALVTYDKDLLCLEKPFGIEIIRPARFLAIV